MTLPSRRDHWSAPDSGYDFDRNLAAFFLLGKAANSAAVAENRFILN